MYWGGQDAHPIRRSLFLALLNQGMNCHFERNEVKRKISQMLHFALATFSMTKLNSYFKSATPYFLCGMGILPVRFASCAKSFSLRSIPQ
jgi:hypothetical protein